VRAGCGLGRPGGLCRSLLLRLASPGPRSADPLLDPPPARGSPPHAPHLTPRPLPTQPNPLQEAERLQDLVKTLSILWAGSTSRPGSPDPGSGQARGSGGLAVRRRASVEGLRHLQGELDVLQRNFSGPPGAGGGDSDTSSPSR
jgi:hypothetical protein